MTATVNVISGGWVRVYRQKCAFNIMGGNIKMDMTPKAIWASFLAVITIKHLGCKRNER